MPKTYIIAELSANHGNSLDVALSTIRAVKDCGADAIKIQTYTADTLTLNCDNAFFQINHGTVWDKKTFYELYSEAYTPWEWHAALQDEAKRLDLDFFSTPFDITSVDFLTELEVPIFKIASFEITDIPLIKYVASKGKPIIISTGIADLAMIEDAVNACKSVGNSQITLLKCTSSYPAPPEEANLATMKNLKETFQVRVGLSDHTMGSDVAIAAVALGAEVIEKHFILDRKIGGPDSTFSMEPKEFTEMVKAIRIVEQAIGNVSYEVTPAVLKSRKFSRSLFISKDIKKGEIFTNDNIRSIRPNDGLSPKFLPDVLGKQASKDLYFGTPLTWSDIEE